MFSYKDFKKLQEIQKQLGETPYSNFEYWRPYIFVAISVISLIVSVIVLVIAYYKLWRIIH
jgi:ABC-type multidrug transport system permease subunit